MDLKDRFPNELWLEVLSYLPPAARRSLSSTHRSVYDLARPLGFIEFTLYSYPDGFRPEKAQLDDALERLRFWASPRIAPHVRSCTISQKMALWKKSDTPVLRNDEHVLMNAFFEHLPHFTRLERLRADQIQLKSTQTGLVNLCGLPALRELHLSEPFALARSEVPPFPNVRSLKIGGDTPHDIVAISNKFPSLRAFSCACHLWRNFAELDTCTGVVDIPGPPRVHRYSPKSSHIRAKGHADSHHPRRRLPVPQTRHRAAGHILLAEHHLPQSGHHHH
ncbi:hypothetical protein C8R45DRAFT_81472 [Mycena sanguinolenta]|nr:hypothetical protein C8R45DRAFT_81472 [Mycena sanguinolenta]